MERVDDLRDRVVGTAAPERRVTVAIVTDSNAQLPEVLRRFDVGVVPLTVVMGGQPFREGIDLTSDEFYARLAAGVEVTTAAPSPGDFVTAYEAAGESRAPPTSCRCTSARTRRAR